MSGAGILAIRATGIVAGGFLLLGILIYRSPLVNGMIPLLNGALLLGTRQR